MNALRQHPSHVGSCAKGNDLIFSTDLLRNVQKLRPWLCQHRWVPRAKQGKVSLVFLPLRCCDPTFPSGVNTGLSPGTAVPQPDLGSLHLMLPIALLIPHS